MTHHTLPGGRFATEHRRDLPALALALARHLGVGAIGPRRATDDPDRFATKARSWSRRVLEWLDIDLHIEGADHIDWDRPAIVAPLHEGMVDPLLLLSTLPGSLRFVARTELSEWPVIGSVLEPSGQILLEPEQPLAAARTLIRRGSEALASGATPVVFPQGTLIGVEAAFESGAFHLAELAGVDVIPIVIAGTHRIYEWPFTPIVRRGQPVYVKVLPPRSPVDVVGLETEMRQIALTNDHAPVRRFEPDRDGWWDGYRFGIANEYPELAARLAQRRAQEPSRRAAM